MIRKIMTGNEKGYLGEPDMKKAEFYYCQGADFENVRCRGRALELFGYNSDLNEEDGTEEDDEDDPFVFDFSKGPRDLRS